MMLSPRDEIVRLIKEKGRITFAEFMEVALYWPFGGYYRSKPVADGHSRPWGAKGDYVTSMDLSPVFATAMARQVYEMWTYLGSPADFVLIEAGAGRGRLSKGILSTVKERWPDLYDALTIRLVERNTYLHESPHEKLSWHEDIGRIPGVDAGVVLSNELIDSMPVHRVAWKNGLKEIYTGIDPDGLIDVLDEPSTPELQAYLDAVDIALVEGMSTEINLEGPRWIASVAGLIKRGFILTIDYGLPARELYSPDRLAGTLMCAFRHTLNDNPYVNVGLQDMTAHVDFTSLVNAGAEAGAGLAGFTTQKNFLIGLGILEELKEVSVEASVNEYEKILHNQRIASLIAPGGAGDAFKVLAQYKGVEKPELKGFSFKELSRYL